MITILAAADDAGGYIMPAKIVLMLLLFAPWLYAAPWINKDARRLMLPRTRWSVIVLCGGILGWLLWFVVPYFIIGMLLYLASAGGTTAAYIVFRNGRVPDSEKVLTSEHLSSIFSRSRRVTVEIATKVKLYGYHGRIVLAPQPQNATAQEIMTYNLAQKLLHDVVYRRASEAELAPLGRQVRLRLAIDGVGVDGPSMSLGEGEAVIGYLKGHGGMDVEDRRRPQRGRIVVDLKGKRVDVVLTSAGTTRGQRMQFRVEQEALRTRLDELGMAPDQLEKLRKMTLGANGLIIVSGRAGSGVTSTLYSLLRQHDAFTKVLVTLERGPQFDLENVTQQAYGQDGRLADMLASALRRDPDVVMVDACPDSQTAAHVVEAAESKNVHLGMRATDSFVALAKWVKASGRPAEALANLRGVLYQVLLRKLCGACKEGYHPDPQLLAKANLRAENIDKFYRQRTRPIRDEKGNPVICGTCQGTGYVGRTGAFELLELTDNLKRLVLSGASIRQIKGECRRSNMLYIQERALEKVISGDTSVQEVIRITQQAKKK
ncbi:MAG: GspE/PulE family protein [Planctomycetota bacterium]|jgi:general secretion pathway protein E